MKLLFIPLVLFFTLLTHAQTTDAETCFNQVNGKVVNKSTGNVIANAFIQLKTNGKIIEEMHSDGSGMFQFKLNCDTRYQVSAVFENYSKSIKLVFTSKTTATHEIVLEMLPLNEFVVENGKKVIVMEPIEFEPDDNTVTQDIAAQLDHVVELLTKYSNIKIEIAFHTNNLGDLTFLKNLSQKRADACSSYIVGKGIDPSRVIATGYGFTNPIEGCNTPEMISRKEKCTKNSRTEFVVISDVVE